jgi:hypothetical protein
MVLVLTFPLLLMLLVLLGVGVVPAEERGGATTGKEATNEPSETPARAAG